MPKYKRSSGPLTPPFVPSYARDFASISSTQLKSQAVEMSPFTAEMINDAPGIRGTGPPAGIVWGSITVEAMAHWLRRFPDQFVLNAAPSGELEVGARGLRQHHGGFGKP